MPTLLAEIQAKSSTDAGSGIFDDVSSAEATSVTFSQPSNLAGGIALGDIPAGQHRAVWARRTVNAAAAVASDSFALRVQCDTNP